MPQTRVVLLYGGKSSEHEISRISAAAVLQNFDTTRYEVIPIGIDKDGNCYINDYRMLKHEYRDNLPICAANARRLDSLVKNGQLAIEADVVFPVMHGPLYEDGALQGLLKHADVAFVGSDVLSSAIGMDKDITRRLALAAGIKAARYQLIPWHIQHQALDDLCRSLPAMLGGWPLFVKPCTLGSSVGISKVASHDELVAAIRDARHYDEEVLVEEYINGREIELAVLDNLHDISAPRVSIPGEICAHHKDGFYSYLAKYIEVDTTELLVPAVLDAQIIARLQQISGEIFTSLKCRGMARVDFFVRGEDIYLNEINTIPGFTAFSMYPAVWAASGVSYQELLAELIDIGIFYHQRRVNLITHYG